MQVNKSATILIQSRQSCCNSVQSSIVKCQYNPAQSIPIPAQFTGLYVDWPIVFGLYNCGIWHRGCGITYTPPYAKKWCQKKLCQLLLDYAVCNWILQLYLDCTIVIGLYNCNWIVRLYLDCTIVFGLCQLYLDCTIVFGLCQLYLDCVNCIWIVSIVFGLYNCRIWYNVV